MGQFASASKRIFVQRHSFENVFPLLVHFHAKQTHFERFCTKSRFETEAQGHSEMVYCLQWDTVPFTMVLKYLKCT